MHVGFNPTIFKEDQKFYSSGGFDEGLYSKCVSIDGNNVREVVEALQSNSEETDLRIWLHCKNAYGTKQLIYSPDTDVYHIGLPLACQWDDRDIYIQQRPSLHENARYLSISNLIQALT